MAKQIKAIKCPQCGSTDFSYNSQDANYTCSNCKTVYFVDDDYVNINVNHQNEPKTNPLKWIVLGIAILGFCVFGLLTCIGYSIFHDENSNNYTVNTTRNDYYRYYFPTLFTSKAGKSMLVATESKRDAGGNEELSFIVRNLETEKEVSKMKIKPGNHYFDSRTFVDKSMYLITEDKTSLFYLDRESCELIDVTEQMFSKHQEFASGLSSIEFAYDKYGEGFKVMTSMGKELYFYPKMDKVLTCDRAWDSQYKANPNLPVITCFAFYFEKFNNYDSEKPQLLFKELYYYEGRKTLKTYELLTPDRVYFKPKVLFSDESELLITFRVNINKDSPIMVQSLKLPTMDVNWSLSLDSRTEPRPGYFVDEVIKQAIKAEDHYYLANQGDRYYKLSKDGILIETQVVNK